MINMIPNMDDINTKQATIKVIIAVSRLINEYQYSKVNTYDDIGIINNIEMTLTSDKSDKNSIFLFIWVLYIM